MSIEKLRSELSYYQGKNKKRHDAINGKRRIALDSVSLPHDTDIMRLAPKVGWTESALNYYVDKMRIEDIISNSTFSNDSEAEYEKVLNNLKQQDGFYETLQQLIKYTLIDGIAYAIISKGDEDMLEDKYILTAHSGNEVAVKLNGQGVVVEALVQRGEVGLYYTKNEITKFTTKDSVEPTSEEIYENDFGFIPVFPINLNGNLYNNVPLITKSAISIEDDANRAMMYLNASRSYYSLPWRNIIDIIPTLLQDENGKSTRIIDTRPGAVNVIPLTEDQLADPSLPSAKVEQVNGQSPTPILENLSVLSRMFAGKLLIPEHDLTGNAANPVSAEAMTVSEQRLNDRIRQYEKNIERCFKLVIKALLSLNSGSIAEPETFRTFANNIRVKFSNLERTNFNARVDAVVKILSTGMVSPTDEYLHEYLWDNASIAKQSALSALALQSTMFLNMLEQESDATKAGN